MYNLQWYYLAHVLWSFWSWDIVGKNHYKPPGFPVIAWHYTGTVSQILILSANILTRCTPALWISFMLPSSSMVPAVHTHFNSVRFLLLLSSAVIIYLAPSHQRKDGKCTWDINWGKIICRPARFTLFTLALCPIQVKTIHFYYLWNNIKINLST